MQESIARRTVDELVTLYELEPEVRDIFVEGRSDRNFLSVHLTTQGESVMYKTYAISDRVHIPDGELIAAGISVGERGRIIWLARQLAARLPGHSSVALVADKDFASLHADANEEIHGLVYTDYSSMEAYAFNERTLNKLLRVPLGAPDYVTAPVILTALRPALVALFIIRLCLRGSGTGVKIPPKTLGKWDLDDQSQDKILEVFRAALQTIPASERNGQTPGELYARYIEYRDIVDSEYRDYINGHDISLLLVRFLKTECGNVFNSDARRPLQNPEVLETVLMACVDTVDLNGERLFEVLREWIQAGVWGK
ncbi:hypothetical protein ACIQU5_01715 [Streptomyces sp. NPDC090306]|uniref:hypothetical protein n=1 Tax=Streptomyces sp. NPDC090306 TaxID=3365961 RepID=UPI0038171ED0